MLLSAILIAGTFILVGAAMLVWPRRFWYLMNGWWSYDNPEQIQLSDAYLILNGIQAFALILAGVIGLYLSLSQWS